MQTIEGILFEPVGCLAEFPAEPFIEIASRLFERKKKPSVSGSRAYWHLLNLLEESGAASSIQSLEIEAVEGAAVYEDVIPALTELKAMGIKLCIASSLSNIAVMRFLTKHSLGELFSSICSQDDAQGIKAKPLIRALAHADLKPEHTMYLTDTAAGLTVANSVGVSSILMMNDPDEARRLTAHQPTGGIVSLHELPDFVRFVTAENTRQ